MLGEEPGGLGASVAECAEYVFIDTHYLDSANAPQNALVYQIIRNALAYIVHDNEDAYVAILKIPVDDIWILETTLRWVEDNLDDNADEVRERRHRIQFYIAVHHAR